MNCHGQGMMLVSFVDGYCTGYHCVRETVAWPAQIGNKWCFCKKEPGINGVIVINDKAFGVIEMTISEYVL